MRNIRTTVVLLACALLLLPGEADARGGRGGGSSFGGSGFSGGSKGLSGSYSAPKASAPSPSSGSKGLRPPPAPATKAPAYDAAASRAKAVEQSRLDFQKANPPPPRAAETPRTSTSAPPPPRPATAQAAAGSPSPQRPSPAGTAGSESSSSRWWGGREPAREPYRSPSAPAYQPSPSVVYHDSGPNPWFWMWLMSNNQNQNRTANDEWVYHNRDRLSPAQLDELRQKDDKLESRLAELEKKGVQRDPNFKHPVVDENNPPRPAEPFRAAPPSGSSFWYWVVGLSGLGLLVYFVGFRRYRSLA